MRILLLSFVCLTGLGKALDTAVSGFGFCKEPCVNKTQIKMFGKWMTDWHPNVVAFDLEEAEKSVWIANGKAFEIISSEVPRIAPLVKLSKTQGHSTSTYFKNRAVKKDPNGTIYLECYRSGGGSGYWSYHMAVKIVNDTQIRYDENDQSNRHSYFMLKPISHLLMDFFKGSEDAP